MVLEFRVKQRVGCSKKNLVGVTVTFWCLSIREPGKIDDTNMARDFDRIHKSVRWPYTYDNTDLLMAGSSSWPRTLDFHSKDQGFESPTRYKQKVEMEEE